MWQLLLLNTHCCCCWCCCFIFTALNQIDAMSCGNFAVRWTTWAWSILPAMLRYESYSSAHLRALNAKAIQQTPVARHEPRGRATSRPHSATVISVTDESWVGDPGADVGFPWRKQHRLPSLFSFSPRIIPCVLSIGIGWMDGCSFFGSSRSRLFGCWCVSCSTEDCRTRVAFDRIAMILR